MKKSSILQNLFCAVFVTSIFAMRWGNCLPFSGYTPALTNLDQLEIWGRYLVWAKEPFHFPKIGIVKSLAFPFQTCNMAHGPMPFFSIIFKLLSKIYHPIGHFYYFTFVELLFVFLTCFFAFRILEEFRIRSFWLKLLGTVTVGLSFTFLYKSTGDPFETAYVPGYVIFAYLYLRAYKYPGFASLLPLVLLFPVAVLIDDYLLLGIAFMMLISVVLNGIGYFVNKNEINRDRVRGMIVVLSLGLLLSSAASYCMGNAGNLIIPHDVTPMTGRDDTRWAYGGGYGGGFHVADVLSVFIPPEYKASLPDFKILGPTAYLAKLGFPITTAKLQDGQFIGFVYIGTVTIGLLLVLAILGLISFLKNYKLYFMKFDLTVISNIFKVNTLFSLPMLMGLTSFLLYIISWGYIIHLGGVRHNDIVTPSLILAEYCHKFMWARCMGRLAIPFMLFMIMGVIVWINNRFFRFIYSEKREIRLLCAVIFLLLAMVHIREIQGYLQPPVVVQGDDITNKFGKQDQALIREVLHGKSALMVTPYAMDNGDWGRICYALAFYGGTPMSGPNTALNEILTPAQFEVDNQDILSGNIRALVNRYGPIVIATRENIADKIMKNADMPLKFYKLSDQDAVLLTLG